MLKQRHFGFVAMFKFPVLLNWSDSCPLRCPFPFSSSKHMFSRTDPRDRSLWLPMILWLGLLWLQLLPISNSSWLFSSHCFSSSSQWMANTLEIFLCLNFRLLGRERGLTGATLPLWKLPETPGSENDHCKSAAEECHCCIIGLPLIGVSTPAPEQTSGCTDLERG